jgi:hypothetical protein
MCLPTQGNRTATNATTATETASQYDRSATVVPLTAAERERRKVRAERDLQGLMDLHGTIIPEPAKEVERLAQLNEAQYAASIESIKRNYRRGLRKFSAAELDAAVAYGAQLDASARIRRGDPSITTPGREVLAQYSAALACGKLRAPGASSPLDNIPFTDADITPYCRFVDGNRALTGKTQVEKRRAYQEAKLAGKVMMV